MCQSRQQLTVDLVRPIEVLANRFEKDRRDEEFDQMAWKEFFKKHAKFKTLCLTCLADKKNEITNNQLC